MYDEFKGAYLGQSYNYFDEDRAVYDLDKCIEILVKEHGLSYDEAFEHLEFNYLQAYLGRNTPIFVRKTE